MAGVSGSILRAMKLLSGNLELPFCLRIQNLSSNHDLS